MKKHYQFFPAKKTSRAKEPIFREPPDSTHGNLCVKCISGVNVIFPFTPYPAQIQLMFKILQGLNKKKNSLLESPTGTGKSLALLCSTLSWQLRWLEKELARAWYEKKGGKQLNIEKCTDSFPVTSVGDEKEDSENRELNRKKRLPTFIDSDCSDDDFQPRKKGKSSMKLNKMTQESIDRIQSYAANPPPKFASSNPASLEPIVVCSQDSMENLSNCQSSQTLREKSNPSSPIKVCSFPTPPPKQTEKAPDEAWSNYELIKIAIHRTPKIFYGTRTHQQIKQVIRELSTTAYRHTPMTILASRDHLCLNTSVLKCADKNEGCREAVLNRSCDYHSGATMLGKQDYLKRFHQAASWDIEDLVQAGRKQVACPYYATRFLLEESLIVFCPYNYLIDPVIRREMKFQLDDQIVVLDEAHNIENISRDAASTQFSQSQLDTAISELDHTQPNKHLSGNVREAIRHLSALLQNLNCWLCGQDESLTQEAFETLSHSWLGADALIEFESFGLSQATMEHYSKNMACMMEELMSGDREEERESPRYKLISHGTVFLLEWLFVVLANVLREDKKYTNDYIISITKKNGLNSPQIVTNKGWISSKKPSWERILNFCCLNPAVSFESLTKTAHSIILTSGTLTPMTSFMSELDCPFQFTASANHVIKSEQVWIGVLSTGPKGVKIEANYRGLEQFSVQDEIGSVLVSLCETVPDGVLCFLPSYSAMEKLRERWESTEIVSKLAQLKLVVWESRGSGKSSSFKEDMNEYFESISSGRGSLLVGVCRGKVSEGIDFADAQARAVMCVGIPFPNWKDHQIQQKREYNDRRRKEGSKDTLSGSQWYEVEAFRALNQALGRCIRHKNDWGSILLVDSRYSNPSYQESLSRWARERARMFHDFNQARVSLRKFISDRISIGIDQTEMF